MAIQALVYSVNRERTPQFEVNEQVLYARMINIEETTLIA